MNGRVVMVASMFLGACFNPQYDTPTCGPNDECPAGTHCVADLCRSDVASDDGGIDAEPSPDSDVSGCYHEANDTGNATAAEPTGIAVPSDAVVICGSLDDRTPAADGIIDVDTYSMAATAGQTYGVRNDAPGAGDFDRGVVVIASTENGAPVGGFGWMADSVGLVTLTATMPTLTVIVRSAGSAALGHAVPYQISVALLDPAARCPAGTAVAGDTLDTVANMSTGNDVLAFGMTAIALPTLSMIDTDGPEPLPALGAGNSITLGGTTEGAHPMPQANDTSWDRDTYQLEVPAGVRSVDMVLRYPAGASDLDLWLVRAGDLRQQGVGYNVGPDVLSVDVTPGTYYLSVAQFAQMAPPAQAYTLSVCPQGAP
jgi:hypothetical protein